MLETNFPLEGLETTEQPKFEGRSFSSFEMDYISEMKDYPGDLVDRIDEFNTTVPPKAIDANGEINDMILPVKDSINPIYLEAPSDSVQIEQISDSMKHVEELRFDNWKESTLETKKGVLQDIEMQIAEIEHRPPCELVYEEMGDGEFGYYDKERGVIALNETYINSDSFTDYKETLDTLIHEGRHAYQEYNLNEREVHPRSGEVDNWRINENETGYLNPQLYGFELYRVQPLEADATAFANDIVRRFLKEYNYKA